MSSSARIFFGRILCPTDLTPESDEALRYAIALARAYRAKLLVFHSDDLRAAGDGLDRGRIARQLEASVLKHLRGGEELPRLEWEGIVVEDDPVIAISREAGQRAVDLIVMRSRRRAHSAALLGSTAESVCRTAPCPVLVTHPQEREWAGLSTNEIDLKRILVAHDFSDYSELALSYALSFAQEYQSELHLIHVLTPADHHRPEMGGLGSRTESAFQQAARLLDRVMPAEARLWCEFKVAVREGPPYREVLAYAEEEKIDLICMGMRGTGFGMKALFGSNVDRVLRQAPCPVVVARPLKPTTISANNGEKS
jgi:nucleotide-binding universal stress UspA family protein